MYGEIPPPCGRRNDVTKRRRMTHPALERCSQGGFAIRPRVHHACVGGGRRFLGSLFDNLHALFSGNDDAAGHVQKKSMFDNARPGRQCCCQAFGV